MNEQLQQALASLIEKTMQGVDSAVGILSSEMPDVVYQLLLWYGVYNFILFLYALIVIFGSTFIFIKFSGQGKRKNDGSYHMTLTHNSYGQIQAHTMVSLSICAFILVSGLSSINLQWLQIWITPKIWLIEYAASLAK